MNLLADKIQHRAAAAEAAFGPHAATVLGNATRSVVKHVPEVIDFFEPPALTFGAAAPYGRCSGYYYPTANLIVLPLCNANTGVARHGVIEEVALPQGPFAEVVAHEVMHSVQAHLNTLDGFAARNDSHGDLAWCSMALRMEAAADPTIATLDGLTAQKLVDIKEAARRGVPHARPIAYWLRGYLPPVDGEGCLIKRPSALVDLYEEMPSLILPKDDVPCQHCGTMFVPKRSTANFCKPACRVAYHRAKKAAQIECNANETSEFAHLVSVTELQQHSTKDQHIST
jgi:hypothetical protein